MDSATKQKQTTFSTEEMDIIAGIKYVSWRSLYIFIVLSELHMVKYRLQQHERCNL